jgi:hypothetical protein
VAGKPAGGGSVPGLIAGSRAGDSRPRTNRKETKMSEEDAVRSEQQEQLELADDREPDGLDSRAWEREDPDAGSASQRPIQLEPADGDGPPVDTEPDEVAVDAGSAPAAGPEQGALHVEDEPR